MVGYRYRLDVDTMKIYYKKREKFYDGWNVIPGWRMLRIISYCKAHNYVRWHLRIRLGWPILQIRDDKSIARASKLKWSNHE